MIYHLNYFDLLPKIQPFFYVASFLFTSVSCTAFLGVIDSELYLRCHRPDVHFHCDINYDPFLFMEKNKKVYG